MARKNNTDLRYRIAELLVEYPSLREKKAYIQAVIWLEQCEDLNINTIEDFLLAYSNNELANAESVRRTACKLMEEYPELRPSIATQEENDRLAELIRRNRGGLLP